MRYPGCHEGVIVGDIYETESGPWADSRGLTCGFVDDRVMRQHWRHRLVCRGWWE